MRIDKLPKKEDNFDNNEYDYDTACASNQGFNQATELAHPFYLQQMVKVLEGLKAEQIFEMEKDDFSQYKIECFNGWINQLIKSLEAQVKEG